MTTKMITDLFQAFQENMKDPVPELSAEMELEESNFLEKLEQDASTEAYPDLEDGAMVLLGLRELKGFAMGMAAPGSWRSSERRPLAGGLHTWEYVL